MAEGTESPTATSREVVSAVKSMMEQGIPLKIYSDWSLRKMKEFLEKWVVQWDDEKQCYMKWNGWHQVYLHELKNDGITYPVERDVDVCSVMATVSGGNASSSGPS